MPFLVALLRNTRYKPWDSIDTKRLLAFNQNKLYELNMYRFLESLSDDDKYLDLTTTTARTVHFAEFRNIYVHWSEWINRN